MKFHFSSCFSKSSRFDLIEDKLTECMESDLYGVSYSYLHELKVNTVETTKIYEELLPDMTQELDLV
jgi:hypothetical protein